jgi:hypothetical protein
MIRTMFEMDKIRCIDFFSYLASDSYSVSIF